MGEHVPPGVLFGRIEAEVLFCDYFDPGKVASPDVATYALMGALKNQGYKHSVQRVVLDEAQCTHFSVQQALAVMGFNKAPQARLSVETIPPARLEWVS